MRSYGVPLVQTSTFFFFASSIHFDISSHRSLKICSADRSINTDRANMVWRCLRRSSIQFIIGLRFLYVWLLSAFVLRDCACVDIPSRASRSHHGKQKILCARLDRKSTRLNSSHANISYAVFCLKKR